MRHDTIKRIMTSRARYPFFSPATALWAASLLYAGANRIRRHAYHRKWYHQRRLPLPVISVGNLTVGGTGKTPMTINLAQHITALGYRPVILSRGYKGRNDAPALVVSDGRRITVTAAQAGDEPFLMAALLKGIPVVVGRRRYQAGLLAIERFQPDLLLLDDGFQHLSLHRDLDLVLLDAQQPFGNHFLLPRGTLREPPAGLKRADAVVLTRCEAQPVYFRQLQRVLQPRPLFTASHTSLVRGLLPADQPCSGDPTALRRVADLGWWFSAKLVAFSGLADNAAFHRSVHRLGLALAGSIDFEDHHLYSRADLGNIFGMARRMRATALVTSDKDFVRLPKAWRSALPIIVLGVALQVTDGPTGWAGFIAERSAALCER